MHPEIHNLVPRLGEWHDTVGTDRPAFGESVLGYWYDGDCPASRVVFCICDEGSLDTERWYDAADINQEVDIPDAWAQIVYPLEGE